ncbi:MAG: hypothetical protein AAFW89_03995 [Bacteroidota bacterium]
MITIRFSLIPVFILACSLSVFAQGLTSSGTTYSGEGAGFPVNTGSAQFTSMGIQGVSLIDLFGSGLSNPALWGTVSRTKGTTGLSISSIDATQNGVTTTNSLLSLNFLHLVFPLQQSKWGLSAAVYPVTSTGYNFSETAVLSPQESFTGDTLRFATSNESRGGISRAEIGLGWLINKRLSIGYAPSLQFMSSEVVTSLGIVANDVNTFTEGFGFAHRFGVFYRIPGSNGTSDILSMGATFTPPSSINTTRFSTSTELVGGDAQTVRFSEEDGEIELPLETSFGVSFFPGRFLNVSTEAQFQQWSTFSNDFEEDSNTKDRWNLGLGLQFHPYRSTRKSFLGALRYDAGIAYDTGHLNIQGNDISTVWFSGGIGILGSSQRRSFSSIDIGVRYGMRGTSADNLVRENIWSVTMSINLGEAMFIRRKLR